MHTGRLADVMRARTGMLNGVQEAIKFVKDQYKYKVHHESKCLQLPRDS